MPRLIFCIAAAWVFIAAPAVAATTVLDRLPANGGAVDRSGPRYAQDDAVRPPPPAGRGYAQAQRPIQGPAQGPAQVYLLRGFLNVFSLGMDDLADKLKADGIAATVMNHADADFVASRILTAYNAGDHGPIMLVGHSLGADAVVDVAAALAHYGVPVALLVLFDGTEPHQIPVNVAGAVNYTKHFMIVPAPGSRGTVQNVDLSGDAGIDHLSIDTAPALQTQTLNYILQAAAPRVPVSRRQ